MMDVDPLTNLHFQPIQELPSGDLYYQTKTSLRIRANAEFSVELQADPLVAIRKKKEAQYVAFEACDWPQSCHALRKGLEDGISFKGFRVLL